MTEALTAAWDAAQWQLAIELLEQIRAAHPQYDEATEKLYGAYVNYGQELLLAGDTEGAAERFIAALGIKSDGAEATDGLHRAAATPIPTQTTEEQLAQRLHEPWAAEDWEEVINLIEQIRAINPDYDDMTEKLYAAHVNQGHDLVLGGNLELAKESYSRALTIKPDAAEAVAGLQQLADGVFPPPSTTSSPPSAQPQYVTYVVQGGDTLYSIARRYGTSVNAVMAANGLADYNIYVGQQLRIPVE
jgi:LysM repeat protein